MPLFADREPFPVSCNLPVFDWDQQCSYLAVSHLTAGNEPLSTELTTLEGPRVSSALSFIGGVHIGARALHVLNLICNFLVQ
jgi:hypothetical protein